MNSNGILLKLFYNLSPIIELGICRYCCFVIDSKIFSGYIFIVIKLFVNFLYVGTYWAYTEVQFLIQSLEAKRDQYLNDDDSNKFSFVREIAKKVVEQNNMLIQEPETLLVS